MASENKGGRPSKISEELIDSIVHMVKTGAYFETAAAYAGVHKDTLYDWLKRGRAEWARLAKDPDARPLKREALYCRFTEKLEKALAESEIADLITIRKASEESWQAAAWRLERKHPERWGRVERSQHEGEVKHIVEIVRRGAG